MEFTENPSPSAPLDKKGPLSQALLRSSDGTPDHSDNESTEKSPVRSLSFRRTGSQGKGPRKTTTPQGPLLATEARSLVRPCNCGKDGVFNKGHHHLHDNHHHKVPPSPERVRREHSAPRSPQVSRKSRVLPQPDKQDATEVIPQTKIPTPEKPQIQEKPQVQEKPQIQEKPQMQEKPQKQVKPQVPEKPRKGLDRFVSTVVWIPELQPEFNSTTLRLSPGEDSMRYIDEILINEYASYVKKMFPNSEKRQINLDSGYSKNENATSIFRNSVQRSMSPHKINPVSVS